MPEYAFKAVNSSGIKVNGVRFANDEHELAQRVKQSGLLLLKYKETTRRQLGISFKGLQLGRISRRELIEFSINMGVMIKAGLPLVNALQELRNDLDNRYFKKVLDAIIEDVESGRPLHESMSQRTRFFPQLYVNVVEIAENTGRLETAFFDLARHYRRIQEMWSNVAKALIYPCFILFVLGLAVYVFLTLVFPSIFKMLAEFKVQLPAVTKVVMAVSGSLKAHSILITGTLVGLVILFFLLRRFEKTRYYIDWFELNTPYIKGFFIQLRMAFFSRYLSVLQNAGVDILRSLELSLQSVNNLVLKKMMADSRQRVIEGGLLSDTLRSVRFVPNMVTRMIAIGEAAGNLPEQLEYVADHYENELERRIDVALALMEPVLIILIAGLVFSLVMAVILPIYKMVTEISSSVGGGGF